MANDTETKTAGAEDASTGAHAGKHLTFRLGSEEYGIEILKVVEIIKLMEITPVPRTPSFVRGVINLRGKVIPVVDLRLKFQMGSIDDSDETCIIVVNTRAASGAIQMGILVDAVSEVYDIKVGDIEPAPKFGSSVATDFILGMAKAKDSVKILLDIDKVLSGDELDALTQL